MKKIFISGATDGIGLATAKSFAALGHELILHGRNSEKLQLAIAEVAAINPEVQVHSYLADLANFSQVQGLIAQIKEDHKQIDTIVNNAGVFKTAKPMLENGMDVRFVVNTISACAIAIGLLPLLSESGRIINLSSAAQAPVDLQALLGIKSINDDFQAYAQSKLAITIWTAEMAKQLKSDQVIVAVNPGSLLASKMVQEGFGIAGNDLSIGAEILVRASLSQSFKDASGKYYDNDAKQFSAVTENVEKNEQLITTIDAILGKHF